MVVPADPRTARRAQPVKFWPRSNTVSPDGACRMAIGRSSRTRRTGGGTGGDRGDGEGARRGTGGPGGSAEGGGGHPGNSRPAADVSPRPQAEGAGGAAGGLH